MNPIRGIPRLSRLTFVPCVLALTLATSAPAQSPSDPNPRTAPAQQPSTSPQPSSQPAQQTAPAAAQQPTAPATPASQQPAVQKPLWQPPAPIRKHKEKVEAAEIPRGHEITEDELKQMLLGKTWYLRGGYLDDSLSFNEHGGLVSRSPVGSYTLSMVEIEKVHLTKHKVELEGVRYGQHFSNQLAFEDPRTAYDKVRITPKKKVLRITIDREAVVKPRKIKLGGKTVYIVNGQVVGAQPAPGNAQNTPPASASAPASSAPPTPAAQSQPSQPDEDEPDTDQAKAEIAAAKPEDRPADPGSVTATTSPDHATMILKKAIDNIFAAGLDDRMMNAMPDFWKLYYKAVAEKKDYRPSDTSVLLQSKVDKKATLLSNFEPDSNQYAQDNGVAGMALYHAVIEPDGTPGEISVARPIGFGLDENAVRAIRAAKFAPAEKDGKPVPVLLDLVVRFRIYSKRTNVTSPSEEASKPAEPVLPGPFTLQHEQEERQAQPDQPQPQQPDQSQPPQSSQPDPAQQQQSQQPVKTQPAQAQQPQL
ncbi:MAG TPA: energy transducer TonB [Terracidiphilus sp.]|nr:energy transducer TonB [Terracidiphilus sp.]